MKPPLANDPITILDGDPVAVNLKLSYVTHEHGEFDVDGFIVVVDAANPSATCALWRTRSVKPLRLNDPVTVIATTFGLIRLVPCVVKSFVIDGFETRPDRPNHTSAEHSHDSEGRLWIRGHHTADSEEGRALLATYAVTQGR